MFNGYGPNTSVRRNIELFKECMDEFRDYHRTFVLDDMKSRGEINSPYINKFNSFIRRIYDFLSFLEIQSDDYILTVFSKYDEDIEEVKKNIKFADKEYDTPIERFLIEYQKKYKNKCTKRRKNENSKNFSRDERSKMSTRLRFEILERDKFTCQYCGCKPAKKKLHIDHIIPISKGGKTEKNNLITSCSKCNLGKYNKKIKVPNHIKEIVN